MSLNPQILTQLEAHGVTQAHLEALLRFLACHENGSFQWHARQGQIERCELRVTFAAKGAVVERVSSVVSEEAGSTMVETHGTSA